MMTTHPLVPELAVAVICRPLDRERHRPDHQRPLHPQFVHDGSAHKASYVKLSAPSPCMEQEHILTASMAYRTAFEMLDTSGVASPPPPRPVIASDIAGPQNDWMLRRIICVKLCCHTRLQRGTVALYWSKSTRGKFESVILGGWMLGCDARTRTRPGFYIQRYPIPISTQSTCGVAPDSDSERVWGPETMEGPNERLAAV